MREARYLVGVRHPASALTALIGALCSIQGAAHGQASPQTAPAPAPAAKPEGVVVQCRPGKVIQDGESVPIQPGRTTLIQVPGGVRASDRTSESKVKIVPITDALLVQPKRGATEGARIQASVSSGGLAGSVPIELEVVDKLPVWSGQYIVVSPAEWEAYEQQERAQQEQRDVGVRQDERDRLYVSAARQRLAGPMRSYATTVQPGWQTAPVRVQFHTADSYGAHPEQELVVPLELTAARDTVATFALDSVEVWDKSTEERLDARVVYVNVPPHEGALVQLAARERAFVFIAVRLRREDAAPVFRVVLRRSGDGAPVTVVGSKWSQTWEEEPKTPEQAEKDRRDAEYVLRQWEEEKKAARDRELAKRTWIGVHGLYGAIWLDDGLPMTEDTDATSLAGFGVRVMKGIFPMSKGPTPMLAFEADLALASSGTASFADVAIDGVQGELQRTARLVRVQVGGVLRFGDPIAAVARIGVGAKGVSQDSELETAGGPVPVLDSSLDVTGGFYVGGGLDIRLGSGFMAGLGLTFIDLGGQRSLEGSLHLDYGLGS